MAADILTMMAVHAHPDDEASSTGGVLAIYADQGIRTVVVTCTNGEFGDAPGQVKPGDDGHDEQAVAQLRLAELRQSCKILGVSDLELLGYHDSGMPDWEYKDRPAAFCNVPLEVVAGRISGLIETYRPQVVISYDDKGMYQHPDHVHAARAAAAAAAQSGIPAKYYQTAMRGSDWRKVWEALRELGADMPDQREFTDEQRRQMEESELRITTNIDILPVLERKREALFAHASQIQDSWFSKLPAEIAGPRSAGRASSGSPIRPELRCRKMICSPDCARPAVRRLRSARWVARRSARCGRARLRPGRLCTAPWQHTLDFGLQGEAEERPDQHNQAEHQDVHQRGSDCHGPDQVRGHEDLQAEQQRSAERLPQRGVGGAPRRSAASAMPERTTRPRR